MLVTLWVINGLLAVAFLAVGVIKLVRPKDALVASGQGWAATAPGLVVKGIGVLEVLAGLGLVLPLALHIAPVLTPLAALGLTLMMLGATTVHLRRKESPMPAAALALVACGQRRAGPRRAALSHAGRSDVSSHSPLLRRSSHLCRSETFNRPVRPPCSPARPEPSTARRSRRRNVPVSAANFHDLLHARVRYRKLLLDPASDALVLESARNG